MLSAKIFSLTSIIPSPFVLAGAGNPGQRKLTNSYNCSEYTNKIKQIRHEEWYLCMYPCIFATAEFCSFQETTNTFYFWKIKIVLTVLIPHSKPLLMILILQKSELKRSNQSNKITYMLSPINPKRTSTVAQQGQPYQWHWHLLSRTVLAQISSVLLPIQLLANVPGEQKAMTLELGSESPMQEPCCSWLPTLTWPCHGCCAEFLEPIIQGEKQQIDKI